MKFQNYYPKFEYLRGKFIKDTKTIQQPFVSITEIRKKFTSMGLDQTLFDKYLIELYDTNHVELEKSFTAHEGEVSGLNYKNRKYFSYILSVS